MRKRLERLSIILVILLMVFSNFKPLYAQSVAEGDLVLENDYIRLNYRYHQGKFKTVSMLNKLTQEAQNTVLMHEDSKEFQLKLLAVPVAKNWQVRVSSEATNEGSGNVKEAIVDGNPGTYWHTNYGRGNGPVHAAFPHWAEITFDEVKSIRRFMYQPRSIVNANGNARAYKFYVKALGSSQFQMVKEGELTYDTSNPIWVELDQNYNNIEAVKFEIHSTRNTRNFGLIAEFDVSSLTQAQADAGLGLDDPNIVIGKDLLVQTINQEETAQAKILKVNYQPVIKKDTAISITRVMTLGKMDKFVRTHLEISIPQDQQNNIAFDTMDIQSFKLLNGEEDVLWKLPQQANISEMGGFNGFYAGLGQPVYLKGAFYTGSEFPLAHNSVDQGVLFSRYYSGKKLNQQNLTDNKYQTWPVALGVSRNNKYEVVQQDFYDYIRQIGTETSFRKQYNSWFDFMKNFNARNIQHSFKEIDEGFTSYGISPLDSYVVDDGWQDNNTVWDFNRNTFPNKLYDSSKDVKRLGSDFGLWLGPQGGYGGSTTTISDAAVREGKGSKNGGVVNVGDKRYVDHLKTLLSSYQDKFDINYWKLDGMLLRPLSNSTEHYIGGGYLNMYSMTETHERWIELYKTLRNNRAGKDLWINLTSYINPSPWFLQWVNSIWMQNAGDVDYQDGVKKQEYRNIDFGSDAAEAITYRDDRYEEVVKLRQWQLPFSNIYNHDPVYGKTAHSSKRLSPGGSPRPEIYFTTDEFRDYLYMLGTRGTGFWEFYYSPSMMDDAKWQVNAEAVNWIENNFEILRNAKIHGGKPGHGEVYGYSAWTQNEGIVSIRNPKDTRQSYSLTLNNNIGMFENTNGLYQKLVHGALKHSNNNVWNYGSTINIDLEPYETVIYQFSKTQDIDAPFVIGSRAKENNKLEVEFNERINPENAVFKHQETTLQAVLNPDLRTFTITLPNTLQDKEKITVHIEGVKDVVGNTATIDETITFYNGGLLLNIPSVRPGAKIVDTGIDRKEEFTVSLSVDLSEYNQTLAEQKGQWKLSVDEEGKVVFEVKGTTVKSAPFTTKQADDKGEVDKKIPLNEKTDIKAIRYENGSLRLYINGLVSNTAYDKATASLELRKADVVVGTEDFKGTISNFRLMQDAMRYNDIAKEADIENEPYVELPIENTEATSYDPDDNGAHPAEYATDGNPSTYWASSRDKNNNTEKQYITIELEEVKDIKSVHYTPRQVNDAVGTITKAKIEVSLDGNSWIGFPTGNGEVDWANDITTKIVVADTPVPGRFVRLYGLETRHWNNEKLNTIVSAAEFGAYGERREENALTFAYLEGEVDNFQNKNETDYSSASYNNAKDIYDRAVAILEDKENYTGTQEDIDNLYEELKQAIEQLTTDKTELNRLIEQAETMKETDAYIEDSQQDKDNFDQALAAAKIVKDDNQAVQSAIDEKKAALQQAISQLDGRSTFKEDAKQAVEEAVRNKAQQIDDDNSLTAEEKADFKTKLQAAKQLIFDEIDEKETKEEVNQIKDEGINTINNTTATATHKPSAKQSLTQAFNSKVEEIENSSLTAEEKIEAKAQAKEIVDTKTQAIDDADTNANVDTLKQEALTSLNAISLDSTVKTEAKNAINQAKENKINQIDENNILTSEEKQEAKDVVNQKATQAITNIDDASDNQAVNTAKENGLTAINDYTKQAETKPNAKQAVLDAFNTKSQEINTRTDLKESEKQDAITRLEAIKNTANNNIDSATTNQAVNNLKQEAINEINTLNPEANSKDEAKAAIQSAIQEKLATVNARKDLTNEEKEVFRNNLEQGKTQAFSSIDRSNDVNEIEQIKQESIRDIQALDIEKTYKQQAKEETDQKLQAKFNQIDGSNLTTEEKDSLKQSLTQNINTQKQAIDDAETVNSVNEARHQITDILDNANLESTMKADAKNAIDQAKQNKISQIDARNDLTDQEKQQAKASVNTKASQAKQAIDYANTNQAVTTAKDEGINEINAVNPNSNAKQDAKDAINQAILEKMNEVNARTDLIDEEKADFQKALDQGKQQIFDAIDRSDNVDEINQIKQAAIENIRSVEIEETYKQQAKDELDDLLQAKINQIDASNLTAEEKDALKQQLTQDINAKKQAIDEASTQAQVDTLRQEASAILENVSLTSNVKAQAKAAITQAQTDKNNSIDARNDLTNEEKASLKQDVETKVIEINTSIDSATTNADVNTAKENGIVAINSLEKTATSKPEAIASVNQAANTKKAQIDARNDLTNEEKQEAKAQVDTYVAQATLAINQANNDQAVLIAKTASINQINTYNKQAEIKPNAILELTNSADAKKAEIRANNNLTNEEKQEAINSIDALLAQHSLNINQAVNNNDVSSNKQDALTVINGFAKVAKVKNNAISEITTALENKVAEIDASLSLNNEEKASLKNQLELIVNNLKQNINSALSNQEVNDFKAQALNRISQTDLLSHRPIILKDNASKVEVHAADRSIFKNQAVKLHVEKQDANLDNYQNEDVDLYDIYIKNQTEEKVNFNGNVSVYLPIKDNRKVKQVIHISENKEIINLPYIIENDKVIFETNHFSLYALVYEAKEVITTTITNTTVNTVVQPKTPELPKTGYSSLTPIAYLSLALAFILYKKKD